MTPTTSLLRPVVRRMPLGSPRPVLRALSTSCPACSATASTPAPASSSSSAAKPKAPKRPVSSCVAGTKLTGLSILKDQPDPVALPDEAYPAWLWTILDAPKSSSSPSAPLSDSSTPEDFARAKKDLRAANRRNIKASNYLKTT